MASTNVWKAAKVVRGPQPLGNAGAQFSLEEVARLATDGRHDPLIVAWARRCLGAARNPPREYDKAAAILEAQRNKVEWVSDPVHSEYMQTARITLAISEGGDCDDVVVLLAAALMSINLRCQIVGHAYDDEHTIQHVLVRVYCDGHWYYAEPSVKGIPLGKLAREPSWTRFIDLPVIKGRKPKVVCDDRACHVSLGNTPPTVLRHEGDFIGVGRLPPAPSPAGVGTIFDVSGSDIARNLEEARLDLILSAQAMNVTHNEMWASARRLGIQPFPATGPGGPVAWTTSDERYYQLLADVTDAVNQMLLEGLSGARRILFDTATNETGVAPLPGDTVRFEFDPNGIPQIVLVQTGQIISLDPSGKPPLSPPPLGVGFSIVQVLTGAAIFAIIGGLIYALVNYHNQVTERERIEADRLKGMETLKQVQDGKLTGDQFNKDQAEITRQKEIEVEIIKANKNPPSLPNLPSGWSDGVKALALLGVVVIGGYAVVKLLPAHPAAPERHPAR